MAASAAAMTRGIPSPSPRPSPILAGPLSPVEIGLALAAAEMGTALDALVPLDTLVMLAALDGTDAEGVLFVVEMFIVIPKDRLWRVGLTSLKSTNLNCEPGFV